MKYVVYSWSAQTPPYPIHLRDQRHICYNQLVCYRDIVVVTIRPPAIPRNQDENQ